ncbi:MAG: DUF2309 family protein [Ferrovum sp.]|jgi:hypothetical protein|nr:DUF2309 family protein [Ferrovum sp.]
MSKVNNMESQPDFEQIIRRIAPVWPLDSFVAVNPYWGFADRSFAEVAAQLQGTVGERMIMDRRWYAEQLSSGKLSLADIVSVINGFDGLIFRLDDGLTA